MNTICVQSIQKLGEKRKNASLNSSVWKESNLDTHSVFFLPCLSPHNVRLHQSPATITYKWFSHDWCLVVEIMDFFFLTQTYTMSFYLSQSILFSCCYLLLLIFRPLSDVAAYVWKCSCMWTGASQENEINYWQVYWCECNTLKNTLLCVWFF